MQRQIRRGKKAFRRDGEKILTYRIAHELGKFAWEVQETVSVLEEAEWKAFFELREEAAKKQANNSKRKR